MVAQLARQLHQNIIDIEDWDVPTFFRYFEHMNQLIRIENSAAEPSPD